MKKAVLSVILLACILSFSLVSAIDITLSKSSYYSGETLQAEIPDAFPTPLLTSNVKIYSQDSAHEFPTQKGIVKSNGKYLFYASLPETSGNYIIKIEDIKHYESSTLVDSVIQNSFSIVSTNASYLAITPGAILATQDFRVTIKSYNAYQKIDVSFSPSNFQQSFSLGYSDSKIITVPITGITEFTDSTLKVGSYNIPVLVSPPNAVQINRSNETEIPEFIGNLADLIAMDTNQLNASMFSNYDYLFQIVIVNKNKSQALQDVSLSSPSQSVKISPEIIPVLSHEEVINLTVNTAYNLDTSLKINYKNNTISIPIQIEIVNNIEDTQSNIPTADSEKTCDQLAGKQCDYANKEKCSVPLRLAKDGDCCVAKCEVPSSNNTGIIVGVIILVILAAIGFVLYQQYKKGNAPEFVNNLLRKKAQDYGKRLSPQEPQEVRKGLSKV